MQNDVVRKEKPKRKTMRLQNFDYSQNYAYFITICTENRRTIFGQVGANSEVVQSFKRHSTIKYIEGVKKGVFPPFQKRIWQRSFHDHIIRNDRDYLEIWDYIDKNPGKWIEDCYYNL